MHICGNGFFATQYLHCATTKYNQIKSAIYPIQSYFKSKKKKRWSFKNANHIDFQAEILAELISKIDSPQAIFTYSSFK